MERRDVLRECSGFDRCSNECDDRSRIKGRLVKEGSVLKCVGEERERAYRGGRDPYNLGRLTRSTWADVNFE